MGGAADASSWWAERGWGSTWFKTSACWRAETAQWSSLGKKGASGQTDVTVPTGVWTSITSVPCALRRTRDPVVNPGGSGDRGHHQ